MEVAGLTPARKRHLHRRALLLEYFTVGWNVIEAVVAITAGVIVGSVALIGFGADSGIEVISAVALLWRLRRADADADADAEAHAERRALYAVAATFFLLAGYIAFESISSRIAGEEPDTSIVGLVLALVSLAIMPALAYWKGRTGREMGSRALQADAVETWVCSYLSLALLIGVGAHAALGWACRPRRRITHAARHPLARLGNARRGSRRRRLSANMANVSQARRRFDAAVVAASPKAAIRSARRRGRCPLAGCGVHSWHGRSGDR